MKSTIIKLIAAAFFLMTCTGCGSASYRSPDTDGSSHTATSQAVQIPSAKIPQKISAFSIAKESLWENKPFSYRDHTYQIKDTGQTPSLTEQKTAQEVSLVTPQKERNPKTKYILDDGFFLSGYFFYSYQECIETIYPEDENGGEGASFDWGKALLCRINLETLQIDRQYTLLTKEQDDAEIPYQIWAADPESGTLWLSRGGKLLVLDLSLQEIAAAALEDSTDILDIFLQDEGYLLTDRGVYQMRFLLNRHHTLEKSHKICTWFDDFDERAAVIGTYGRFLYGYSYYYGMGTGKTAGHYFQVDLDGKRCNVLSADRNKSFLGSYDAESDFDTTAFERKHELYSKGRDNEDESWDPIDVRYLLSEDGSVDIQTEKTEEEESS